MTTYEDVKDQTTEEYFEGNQFSIDAFNKKYKLHEDETYVKALKRVCDEIASVEDSEYQKEYWSDRWFDEIYNDWWHPAGSIMQGAGNHKSVSLSNCTTLSLGACSDDDWDNLESIIRNTGYSVAKCAANRQGLGVDFSKLRPRGALVGNSANESTGSIDWMCFIDSIARYVGQKGRIPAMLFSICCNHPDIEEFIKVKSDYTKIQNANISVQCTDKFYEAVHNNEDWTLTFEIPEVKMGEKVYIDVHSTNMDSQEDENGWYYISPKDRPYQKVEKTIKAKALLELIAKNMWANAEPGIQNIDVARKYSNSDYVGSVILSTNACSEQYLSRDSLCVLSSINCEKFDTEEKVYSEQLDKIAHSINRFLDNVNEYELRHSKYATPHQKIAIENLRRTGAGFTNLAAWLLKCDVEYGTIKGNDLAANFQRLYNFFLYKSSIELGKEKGNFGLFDRKKLEKSPFIKRMMEQGLKFTHLRNVTVSSIAPTGTLTLMFRGCVLSYGIEPPFGLYYWKRTRISGEYKYYFCVPRIVRDIFDKEGHHIDISSDMLEDSWDGKIGKPIAKFIEEHKDKVGIKFRSSLDIKPSEKLDLMSKVMQYVDSSISTTYMLPEGSSWEDVYSFILDAHKQEVKSIAAFPDRKMYGIISFIPFRELAVKLTNEGILLDRSNFTLDEQKYLESESKYNLSQGEHILINNAPKRPKKLRCDLHHIRITKKLDKIRTFDYVVAVGLLNNTEPYEVFVMENSEITKSQTEGKIIKHTKGRYDIELADGILIKDICSQTTETEDAITRLVSTSLRHGTQIEFVVSQLGKSKGDIHSFSKAIGRALKTYIKDGESKLKCPSCGSPMQYLDGCKSCTKCGYSKCD